MSLVDTLNDTELLPLAPSQSLGVIHAPKLTEDRGCRLWCFAT